MWVSPPAESSATRVAARAVPGHGRSHHQEMSEAAKPRGSPSKADFAESLHYFLSSTYPGAPSIDGTPQTEARMGMAAPCQPPATKPSHPPPATKPFHPSTWPGMHWGSQASQETRLRPPAILPGGSGEAPGPPRCCLIGESTQWRGSNSPRVLAQSQMRLGTPQSSLA